MSSYTSPVSSTTVTSDSAGGVATSTTTYAYASPVVAKTTDYTVLASDSGRTLTTRGAAGTVAFTLPALQDGLTYTFVAIAAFTMTVVGGSGTIKGATSFSGTTITVAAGTASVQYANVTLRCDGTNWLIINAQGVVTVA